jgi:hypothetical protein
VVVVFGVVDDHIDDLDPAVESAAGTNEEVILVEHLEDVSLELF